MFVRMCVYVFMFVCVLWVSMFVFEVVCVFIYECVFVCM